MRKLIRMFRKLWNAITGRRVGNKDSLGALVGNNKPGGMRSKALKKRKKVSEMNTKERTWYFAEKRFEWLIKHGYNSRIHVPSDPKPDPSPTHYRATLLKIAKICSDRGERNINKAQKKNFEGEIDRSDTNKHGIRMANYGL